VISSVSVDEYISKVLLYVLVGTIRRVLSKICVYVNFCWVIMKVSVVVCVWDFFFGGGLVSVTFIVSLNVGIS